MCLRARCALLLVVTSPAACGVSVERGHDAAAAGASAGTTLATDGGSAGMDGNGGYAGLSPNGATGGTPACDGNLAGYGDTSDGARPMIPFSFERGSLPDSADCGTESAWGSPGTPCAALARVENGGQTFSMTFEDGGKLTWIGPNESMVGPPVATTDAQVWVEYSVSKKTVCPVCGGYTESSLRVLDADQTTLLWFGQEGPLLEPLSPTTVMELLGVSATDVLPCRQEVGACTKATRTTSAHSLGTDPPELVPAAVPTRISTPKGDFEVSWVSSTTSDQHFQTGCADGPGLATDNGFALRRLAE